jgi:hypothetical protein
MALAEVLCCTLISAAIAAVMFEAVGAAISSCGTLTRCREAAADYCFITQEICSIRAASSGVTRRGVWSAETVREGRLAGIAFADVEVRSEGRLVLWRLWGVLGRE